MIDVAIAREDGGIRTMLELCAHSRMSRVLARRLTSIFSLRSLTGRGWDNSALVLRQLEGIGEKSELFLKRLSCPTR